MPAASAEMLFVWKKRVRWVGENLTVGIGSMQDRPAGGRARMGVIGPGWKAQMGCEAVPTCQETAKSRRWHFATFHPRSQRHTLRPSPSSSNIQQHLHHIHYVPRHVRYIDPRSSASTTKPSETARLRRYRSSRRRVSFQRRLQLRGLR